MRSSEAVRKVVHISALPGAIPNAGSPIEAWVTVAIAKSSDGKLPARSAVSAGISAASAFIGEMPVSGAAA